jgi:D-alanyl-D-alanine carboxypeptidase
MKLPSNKVLAIITGGLALIAIFFLSSGPVVQTSTPVSNSVFINPFATTSLQARSVFVFAPASNHVMYQSNADIPLPLASVTKIMTAYVTSNIFADDDIITIQSSDLAPEGDGGINPGERWKFSDLRDVTLIASANDAAEALRRAADERLAAQGSASTTISIMNGEGKQHMLGTLNFSSVSGLDNPLTQEATAYGSARDIALAFTYIIRERPDIFEATRESSIVRGPQNGAQKIFKNTNVTINDMPSIIASKTGYTDAAGGNLVTAFDAGLGSPIVIAVLGSTNQDTRFQDMLQLAQKAVQYINGTYYSGL